MTVKQLMVRNFRNYECQVIDFGEGINILYGNNAQGKTNILEALYIAATGKSYRTNNYQDLIQYGKLSFEIKLSALTDERENSILIRHSKGKGRFIEVNGVKRDKISDILGTFNIIMFSPETLEIVKGSPQLRRKFLDILLCQTDRKYLFYLQQYNKLIKNKSVALRRGREDRKFDEVIPVWNERISVLGGKIAALRNETLHKLNRHMNEEIKKITSGKETSLLIYNTFCECSENSDEKYFENQLRKKLNEGIEKEFRLCQCLYGPHRDDFEILLNGMNSRHYCSQGQQRTLALSLIISQLYYIKEVKNEKPVLLLDDVMSELDLSRQEYLLNGLYDVQTMITTTDALAFSNMDNRKIRRFYVENGKVFYES
ncbi:MAG: DNA replication/repair protein RecF [Clostridiaceae bacterium]|nr:DNA replication/repair protein RecF [Clostridiaceae bacterium]